jgi:hypothetical protein
MNKAFLIFVSVSCFFMLVITACSGKKINHKLLGKWQSKTNGKLTITDKQFAMDSPEPEDYFIKGDTIYTSFQGNLPYTKYVIKRLDDHQLTIFTPDSALVEYTK